MAARVAVSLVLLSLVLLLASERVVVRSESTEDKMALLDFESKVPHVRNLNWNANTSACDWVGVKCNAERERVIELRLPAVGLYGEIPSGTVGRLSELRVLSLRSNRLSGQLPGDLFTNTPFLRSVYLQNNLFSGPLPQTFTSTRISRLDLSFNGFNSSIPFSFNSLTQLSLLYLQNNSLVSTIPNLNLPNLKFLNLSNNRLNGSIPRSLDRFGRSSFTGNAGLCGAPLAECRPFFLAPAPAPENPAVLRNKKKKLSTGALAAVIVGAAALLFLILACLLLLCTKRRTAKASREGVGVKKSDLPGTAVEKGGAGKDEYPASSSQEAERNKLVFFEGSAYSFDLEDLLRASAEVLGKGSVGTSYKAVLEDGTTVVVKRLKDVVATRKDFEQQMDLVGNIRHSNLLPLRAFYYSKDEKLLVYDYIPNGSLSAVLHGGNRGAGRTPLDWDTRMRIAMGAAKGIAHIHSSGGGKFTHGNIKSSNILLTAGETSCLVSDFGLVGLFSAAAAANRIAGYRAPEVLETRKVTQKSDVYSFGVLLLELLTGKSPTQASLNDESIDLPRWVQSVVREEWTAEVFDVELMRYQNIEEEMVQLLQIAMACVAASPDQRPSMADVLKMMRQMRPEYDSPSSDPNNNNNNTNIRSSNDDNKAGAPAPPPSASAAVASSSSS